MKTYRPIRRFLLSLFFAVLMTPLLISNDTINNVLGYVFITMFVFIFLFGLTRYITFKEDAFKTNFRMKILLHRCDDKHIKKNVFKFDEINITKFEEHGQSMRKFKIMTLILKNKDKYIINLSSFSDDQYESIKKHFNKSIT